MTIPPIGGPALRVKCKLKYPPVLYFMQYSKQVPEEDHHSGLGPLPQSMMFITSSVFRYSQAADD
jgi:hypothetical protein